MNRLGGERHGVVIHHDRRVDGPEDLARQSLGREEQVEAHFVHGRELMTPQLRPNPAFHRTARIEPVHCLPDPRGPAAASHATDLNRSDDLALAIEDFFVDSG